MKEKARIFGATGGAVGLGAFAMALGTCCVAPWAVSLLGVSGAIALVRLSFLKPFALAGAGALLAVCFWYAYRPLPVCADGTCEADNRRGLRITVWLAAVLVAALVFASFPSHVLGVGGP